MNSLQLASIQLRVADLARSVGFYARQLGFVELPRRDRRVELAVAPRTPALLTLVEERSSPHPPAGAAGLFHAALLLPSRPALGAWLRFAADHGVRFDGFSDHGVSEAIYFTDPDGNGLEFYADRPREAWPFSSDGTLAMVTRPLDLRSLLAAATPASTTPLAQSRWGHLHLRVTDLDRSESFYRDALGVALTQGSYPGARFLAADGYHHHVGLNTWGGVNSPQPPHALGLISARFLSPSRSAATLHDPDGIAIEIAPA